MPVVHLIVYFVLAAVTPAPVTFSWAVSSTPKIKEQWLRCGLSRGGPYTRYKLSIGAKKTSAVLKVTPGVPLFCVVTAVGSTGIESGASNEVSITP
jgi:hypothetical protein